MYRSSHEADRARIAALEQQLADAHEALKTAGVDPPLSPEELGERLEGPGLHLLLISGGLFVLLAIAVAFRCTVPEEPAAAPAAPSGDPLRVGDYP